MTEFTPINTQEELDAIIGKRLKRERETIAAQYSDYDDLKAKVTDYEGQITALTAQRDDLQGQVKTHETNSVKMRIARETGIPYELASRLSGETEDDIRTDAKTMAQYLTANRKPAPLANTEHTGTDDQKKAALKKMLQDMRGD